jgi:hypothetical protein
MYYSLLKHDIEKWYLWDEKKEMRIRIYQAIGLFIAFNSPLVISIIIYLYFFYDEYQLNFYGGLIIYLIFLPFFNKFAILRLKDAKEVNQYLKGSWAIIFKNDKLLKKKIIREIETAFSECQPPRKIKIDHDFIFNSEGFEIMFFEMYIIDDVKFKELRILTDKVEDDKLVELIKKRVSNIIEKDGQYKS